MGRLSGKVALVTGAGKGIGESIARLLAAEGARVLVAGRTEADVMAVARDIGPSAAGFVLDVGRADDWQAAIGRTSQLWGKLNILVNNAGITLAGVHRGHFGGQLAPPDDNQPGQRLLRL
jgi:NAD(P)-dependent dehydrogenase (short-subunit alcohol dehydrogenase family)